MFALLCEHFFSLVLVSEFSVGWMTRALFYFILEFHGLFFRGSHGRYRADARDLLNPIYFSLYYVGKPEELEFGEQVFLVSTDVRIVHVLVLLAGFTGQ